jgi:hypothetical protein
MQKKVYSWADVHAALAAKTREIKWNHVAVLINALGRLSGRLRALRSSYLFSALPSPSPTALLAAPSTCARRSNIRYSLRYSLRCSTHEISSMTLRELVLPGLHCYALAMRTYRLLP